MGSILISGCFAHHQANGTIIFLAGFPFFFDVESIGTKFGFLEDIWADFNYSEAVVKKSLSFSSTKFDIIK